jgi:molybdate transport system permease protein
MGVLALFLSAVLALVVADALYAGPGTILSAFRQPHIRYAIKLSLITSIITAYLVILFSIPIGYALSRYRFPGRVLADALVDLPMVMPPVMIGVSLLVFFVSPVGRWIEQFTPVAFTVKGIILCQFFVAVSYGIRASKAAFDGVDPALEDLALTLGATRWRAFRQVALPLAWHGLLAGAIMGWARAVGVFGPLLVFAGAVRMRTEVMPTTIYLELSIGNIERAVAVALLMLVMATVALTIIHWLGSRRYWGA